jgi:multiple sugar transport system permease protein
MRAKAIATEAKLLLIGIPVFLWTIIPVYHLFLFAISPRDSATSGKLWPTHPTLQNFAFVFEQKHFYLNHFWLQMGNCIWVLKQASDKLPWELDEAARMDGATPLQLFRLVYLPLMVPSLVAVGTYALLLAWNEYLYAFLLLSNDRSVTLAVALGNFLSADDSPWELLMATGFIYALPPAAIYYAFKRYMVGGLTAGAVKS